MKIPEDWSADWDVEDRETFLASIKEEREDEQVSEKKLEETIVNEWN
jgi:hypothetical protein